VNIHEKEDYAGLGRIRTEGGISNISALVGEMMEGPYLEIASDILWVGSAG
jgi:hypothetical protein